MEEVLSDQNMNIRLYIHIYKISDFFPLKRHLVIRIFLVITVAEGGAFLGRSQECRYYFTMHGTVPNSKDLSSSKC